MDVERGKVPHASQRNLVGERIFCFGVQFFSMRVDDSKVRGVLAWSRPSEVGSQGCGYKFVALGTSGRATIQGGYQIFRQSDDSFSSHGGNGTAVPFVVQGTTTRRLRIHNVASAWRSGLPYPSRQHPHARHDCGCLTFRLTGRRQWRAATLLTVRVEAGVSCRHRR